jgi:hypothetical protein
MRHRPTERGNGVVIFQTFSSASRQVELESLAALLTHSLADATTQIGEIDRLSLLV